MTHAMNFCLGGRFEDLLEVRVHRVLRVMGDHPLRQERTAAAHDAFIVACSNLLFGWFFGRLRQFFLDVRPLIG